MNVTVYVCAHLYLLASLRLHWGYQRQFSSHQAARHSPSAPPCVMCTVSEIYRSINKTIKQQFSLPLPHCTATEYVHFSFPLSGTLVSGSKEEGKEMRGNEKSQKREGRVEGQREAVSLCRKVQLGKSEREHVQKGILKEKQDREIKGGEIHFVRLNP